MLSSFTLSLALAATRAPYSQVETSSRPPFAQIQTSVLVPPTMFFANGQRFLTYEIELTNWTTQRWTIKSVTVNGDHGPLQEITGEDFGASLTNPARRMKHGDDEPNVLAPSESVIAFMWVKLPIGAPAPKQIRHHYTVTIANDTMPYEIDGPSTPVLSQLRTITPPLRGKNWVAFYGPSNDSPHRRSVHVMDGVAHLGQRYAIDWEKVDDDMKTSHGDPKDNRNYLCFGLEALAVADGTVVQLKDGIPENVPNEPPVVTLTLDTVAGNHIDLDLGGGVYAIYGHLQPGSLRVKLGQRVRRGQVLGLLGNTGNSTEPHLHFQLMDRNSVLDSDGLPYRFTQFRVTKRMSGDGDHAATVLAKPEIHRGEIPLDREIVDFE